MSATESAPVSGVEIRNETSGARPAPCFFKDAAAGSTPHEHRGIGAPKSAARPTERVSFRPRCRAMRSAGR